MKKAVKRKLGIPRLMLCGASLPTDNGLTWDVLIIAAAVLDITAALLSILAADVVV